MIPCSNERSPLMPRNRFALSGFCHCSRPGQKPTVVVDANFSALHGGKLCARWRYASQPNALQAGEPGPLSGLIEALDPLGMPKVQYASRRSYGGWGTRTRAAMYAACSAAGPIAINVAVVAIHLAAIRFVLLPIGTA